ncbi:MAG: DNA ligase [Cellvibrionaceae bacterium]|nr:DNA ligase [Cellvibrionaceae bacterium]
MTAFPFQTQLLVCCRLLCVVCIFVSETLSATSQPKLLLANTYQPDIIVDDYWISEKYDGFRAFWDGESLWSRQGNKFEAPSWFIKGFPPQPLDGELWIGRQQFELLASTVSRAKAHEGWRKVSFMVFDLPGSSQPFSERLEILQVLISGSASPYLKAVPQFRLSTHDQLLQELERRVAAGAEGLMLHHGESYYRSGRSSYLLKLKPLQDAEAKVLQHLPGKGKYHSMLGSLLVELPNGLQFRLGTGFTDAQRQTPPAVGAIVTFQYSGLTRRGIPRFARFHRQRFDVDWDTLKTDQ